MLETSVMKELKTIQEDLSMVDEKEVTNDLDPRILWAAAINHFFGSGEKNNAVNEGCSRKVSQNYSENNGDGVLS